MTTNLVETAATAPAVTGPGRIKVGLITPGWGSSGYYSDKVLENAAADRVWPAGTHIFFDHPSESEIHDRPERSVRDLAAVTTEDATWDGTGLVAEAKVIGPYRDLVTDDVFTEAVGMSIRASAETTTGEAGGRKGVIVSRLIEGQSVDLVTRAGRGGKVLAVLESAIAEASTKPWSGFTASDYDDAQWKKACVLDKGEGDTAKQRYGLPVREPAGALNENGVKAAAAALAGARGGVKASPAAKKAAAKKLIALYKQIDADPPASLTKAAGATTEAAITEALTGETRDMLAIALDGDGWVVDHDPDASTVIYRREWRDGDEYRSELLQATYTANGNTATVNDDGVQVRQQVTYVPVAAQSPADEAASQAPNLPAPAGQSTATESQGDDMAHTQIEESELARLRQDSERVQTLESERDDARREVAEHQARDTARPIAAQIVGESDSLPAATQARVVESVLGQLPTTDSGALDEDAFRAAVETARTTAETEVAQIAEALGAGKITGFGGQSTNGEVSEADFDASFTTQEA